MTREEILTRIVSELQNVAPGCEPEHADPDADLREELDIDSMDFLNFIIALHKKLDIEIPESDYPKLSTLNNVVTYIENKLAG